MSISSTECSKPCHWGWWASGLPGEADVIHWNEGKGLDPLERSSDARAQYLALRDKVKAREVPPL